MTHSVELELTVETEKYRIEIDFEYLDCVLYILDVSTEEGGLACSMFFFEVPLTYLFPQHRKALVSKTQSICVSFSIRKKDSEF